VSGVAGATISMRSVWFTATAADQMNVAVVAPAAQRIVPRDKPQGRSEAAPRASSAPASSSGGGFEARVQPEIGGGWSADGEPATPPKKK